VLGLFASNLYVDFVGMDTHAHLLNNENVQGLTWSNVKAIFAGQRTTSSYYPVRSLSYALDYQLWGFNPFGFKLTNLLIHVANVLLVFWLMLRLFRRATQNQAPDMPPPSSPSTRWSSSPWLGCRAAKSCS
jgi:hypothetical protein